jgi:hypothetical protein
LSPAIAEHEFMRSRAHRGAPCQGRGVPRRVDGVLPLAFSSSTVGGSTEVPSIAAKIPDAFFVNASDGP